MVSQKFLILKKIVIEKSEADDWELAKKEWYVFDYEKNNKIKGTCKCTQEDLVHQYRIKNYKNSKELFPIGSRCINHFQEAEMEEQMKRLDKIERMGERELRYGKYKGKMFKEVPKDYIDFLRKCSHLKKTYDQLIGYDDLKREQEQVQAKKQTHRNKCICCYPYYHPNHPDCRCDGTGVTGYGYTPLSNPF